MCTDLKDCDCPHTQEEYMTLKIEVGKKYVDRSRTILTCVYKSKEVKDKAPYLCVFSSQFSESSRWLTENGTHSVVGHISNTDAVKEYKEPVYKWFNVYKEYVGSNRFTSKDSADAQARISVEWCTRIACVKIDTETGECVNESI